jgi:hypothetical protein
MKKIRTAYAAIITAIILSPSFALAQTGVAKVTSGLGDIGSIINALTNSVVKSLATLFATAAMVAFFFGIVQFIWGARDGDATKAKNGKNFMLWGLVGLFVMFSVWGIITYVQQIFGVTQNTINIPTIQINTSSGGTTGASGLPADGTAYWRCNGQVYATQAAYDAACPSAAGANPSSTGGGSAPGSTTSSSCAGKSEGSSCTVSGRAGTCTTDTDNQKFDCYVTAGANSCSGMTDNQRIACLRDIPCPDTTEIRDANGNCMAPPNP